MKYIVLVGDGMADYKYRELGWKTPLQYAKTPHMDFLAANGETGLVKTIPDGFPPGSDVANLSVLGYDPCLYYTGRSPLEAASMGIELAENDLAFRCNLVTLSPDEVYKQKRMIDYSAGEISTEEAKILIAAVNRNLGSDEVQFFPGISYRHLMIWRNCTGDSTLNLTPPHDISGRCIAGFLPRGDKGGALLNLMEKSSLFLSSHPINLEKTKCNKPPANSIWFWGEGKRASLPPFREKFRLQGSVISAVDLIKGIGVCAGLAVVNIPGATGNIHTNFRGKAVAGLAELRRGNDFIFIHVEAPDEAGHQGDLETKIKAIEEIDQKVLGELLRTLDDFGRYRIMLLPDHPTPVSIKTHTKEPVPFVILTGGNKTARNKPATFDEDSAGASNLYFPAGHLLMEYFTEIAGLRQV
jgi:2,3-bisphosphoglycerate-independent phosphoglycerate mutase